MSFPEMPTDPVELVEIRAQQSMGDGFEIDATDHNLLAELDHGAEQLGFIGERYFIETRRAMIIPASFDGSQPIHYTNFFGLTFEGIFATYSKVHIGRLIGGGAVRAVCLTFPSATLLPYFESLGESDLLYVPALAVSSIQ